MNKRTSYIAAAAVAIAGTAGMASWLALEADGPRVEAQALLAQNATAQPGVAETEAVLPAMQPDETAQPVIEQPAMYAPAPVNAARPRVDRASRTPIATAPAREPERAPSAAAPNPEPRTNEPGTEPVEPKEPVEPVEPVEPLESRFVEVRVPSGTVLGVRLSTSVSSDTAELDDRVEATVTRDVIAEGRVAIPAGTTVLGSVYEVTRGGKFKERARLGIRFHTLVLADGTRETVRVDAIARDGDSPTRASAAKIGGGAVGGAIIGGIMGGKKGAILGGAAGAGAGTAAVVAGDRSVAALASGAPLSVRLDAPVSMRIERNQ